jgi:surface protein
MPTINNLNQFLVPAQDAFLYQLIYNKVYGGNTGCTVNINGTTVQMGANSSIDILVETISGGTGCLLSGDRPNVFGDSPQYKYVPQTFVSVWDTSRTSTGSSTATQIRLPLVSTGTYNFIVDWGDGSIDRITTWNQAEVTHTYARAGVYQLTITGTLYGFTFYNGSTGVGDRLKLLTIFKWGSGFRLGNNAGYFWGCENLQLNEVEDVLDLTNTTHFGSIFRDCFNLTTVNRINEWDTSKITLMGGVFLNCFRFNQDISNWDTSNVTDMILMFQCTGARGVFNQYIGNWNTSKVTNMGQMFVNQPNFNQDISTKIVTTANGSSYVAWDTSNVTTMNFMFGGTTGIRGVFNQNIGNWNTSKVTNMASMFQNQANFNQDLSTKVVTVSGSPYIAWDTSNVTTMGFMFGGSETNTSFNGNVTNWNTSKVTNMQSMFNAKNKFNQDLSTKVVTVSGSPYIAWDTSNVTNMGFMFNNLVIDGEFNQNIGNWNTNRVTNMSQLFTGQPMFNQDISTKVVTVSGSPYVAWNVSGVTNMSFILFSYSPRFNRMSGNFNQDISNWNTRAVTTTQSMFYNQINFNQNLSTKQVTVGSLTYSAWTMSAVTNMGFMFYVDSATTSGSALGSFNNSGSTLINNWDVRRVTGATDMFNNQIGFNQPIGNWNISGVTAFSSTGLTSGFMFGKTFNDYSTANYDALLIGWATRNVRPNQLLNMGTIKYTSAAVSARNTLTSAPNNWTIIDGGLA